MRTHGVLQWVMNIILSHVPQRARPQFRLFNQVSINQFSCSLWHNSATRQFKVTCIIKRHSHTQSEKLQDTQLHIKMLIKSYRPMCGFVKTICAVGFSITALVQLYNYVELRKEKERTLYKMLFDWSSLPQTSPLFPSR